MVSKCLTHPSTGCPSVPRIRVCDFQSVSHIRVYGYQVSECLAYLSVSHIRVYGFQVSHISECMVSKCITCPSVWFPSVIVYSISECTVSKCLTYPSVRLYSISECLTYPSVWFPSVWFPSVWFPSVWFPSVWFPSVWFPRVPHNRRVIYSRQSIRMCHTGSVPPIPYHCPHDHIILIIILSA